MLKIIVAMDEQRGIGLNNHLPWSIKEDLKEFKRITLGHGVIMGRKTLDSIGKPLSGRTNYVVTHQKSLPYESIILVNDVRRFFHENEKSEDVVFVIGGASLYEIALDYADELIISEVKGHYLCDTFFPAFDPEHYDLVSSIEFDLFTQKRFVRKPR